MNKKTDNKVLNQLEKTKSPRMPMRQRLI